MNPEYDSGVSVPPPVFVNFIAGTVDDHVSELLNVDGTTNQELRVAEQVVFLFTEAHPVGTDIVYVR